MDVPSVGDPIKGSPEGRLNAALLYTKVLAEEKYCGVVIAISLLSLVRGSLHLRQSLGNEKITEENSVIFSFKVWIYEKWLVRKLWGILLLPLSYYR
ncbi:hypothetical protein [Hominenteromicrobium sp.]|uniref:hypothetical protein n=1 Tax=Hominenteromicrobium sp. TaxID=3073581 RepID=UPI00399B613B